MALWGAWWAWAAAAIVLAVAEVILPGFFMLGFALGAGVVGLVLLLGGSWTAGLGASLPLLFLVFAVASLVAWLGLRRWAGVYRGQVKRFDRDINDG